MMTLVLGGSGSGKSAYAEDYICRHFPDQKKYYIATMEVYDEEGRRRVEKHRRQRAGKGFETLEAPRGIAELAVGRPGEEAAALLECLSNLVANEMFGQRDVGRRTDDAETVARQICEDLKGLSGRLDGLVIVSNNIFEDGMAYETSTQEYIRALGRANEMLARAADAVIEVVVGIPCVWKGCE